VAYTTQIKVRGYHLDFYGHVNNARYLEFLEEARWALLEGNVDLDDWRTRGLAFAVVNININYRLPAVQGDLLEIRSTLKHMGGKCAVIHQDVVRIPNTRDEVEQQVADADITFVVIDLATNRAVPLEGEAGDVIQAMAHEGGV